jgi:hypothetical protein
LSFQRRTSSALLVDWPPAGSLPWAARTHYTATYAAPGSSSSTCPATPLHCVWSTTPRLTMQRHTPQDSSSCGSPPTPPALPTVNHNPKDTVGPTTCDPQSSCFELNCFKTYPDTCGPIQSVGKHVVTFAVVSESDTTVNFGPMLQPQRLHWASSDWTYRDPKGPAQGKSAGCMHTQLQV